MRTQPLHKPYGSYVTHSQLLRRAAYRSRGGGPQR